MENNYIHSYVICIDYILNDFSSIGVNIQLHKSDRFHHHVIPT